MFIEKTIKDVKPLSEWRKAKKERKVMKKTNNEILMLQYQIKRYQAMGNGTMCQALHTKLQKLLTK